MADAEKNFHETEVAELSLAIVRWLKPHPADIGVKAAALRVASAALTESVTTAALAVMIHNAINPKR